MSPFILKTVGAAMVMIAAASLGLAGRKRLAARVRELERLRWELGRLRARMASCGLSLEDCFGQSELFSPAAEGLRRGEPPERALTRCEISAEGLTLFAAGLGAETLDGQLRNIDIFSENVTDAVRTAREELSKKGRLYLGLGVLGGAAVCVMLC